VKGDKGTLGFYIIRGAAGIGSTFFLGDGFTCLPLAVFFGIKLLGIFG
jgi:hypothetical protein